MCLIGTTMTYARGSLKAQVAINPTEAQIVLLLRTARQLSRSELARRMGYSRASMTSFISDLIEANILREVGEGASRGGRRPLILEINGDYGYIAGYDIGATSIDLALANFRGDILEHCSEPADVRNDAEEVFGRCAEIVRQMLERQGGTAQQVVAVGVGVPGPVEFAKGVLIAPPLMPTWENFPIKKFVAQTFPNATVVVDNDVNIMAIGEAYAGKRNGLKNFIWVKIGTGIGSGIIANGEIYRGANGVAGNIGHIEADHKGPICHCGNQGCLEAMAAGPPIAQRGKKAAEAGSSQFLAKRLKENNGKLTSEDVGDAAASGDITAIEIIRDSGWLIGSVLAGLVEFFNPAVIYIGGGVSKIGFTLLSSVRQAILQRANPLSTRDLHVEYSELGDMAGVVGAISLTFPHIFTVDSLNNRR
jgi:glucokinase-like ROK family protein